MRIGVITFHRAFNAGAVLQAYALQEVLKRLGHSVVFPDCNRVGDEPLPSFTSDERGWRRFVLRLRYLISRSRIKYSLHIQRKRFREFVDKRLAVANIAPSKLGDACDVAVFGSDQIWNPRLSQGDWHPFGGTRLFFGETVDDRVRRIAYGASIGDRPLPSEQAERLRAAAGRFAAISVREVSSGIGLYDERGRCPSVVCDPTMLLKASDYESVMPPQRVRKGKFVLAYALHETPFVRRCAELARDFHNLPVVVLPMYFTWQSDSLWKAHHGFGPGEFLAFFRDAECVLASSFHGTVFATLFGKPFVSIRDRRDAVESRPAALLRELGQLERLVTPESAAEKWLPLLNRSLDDAVFDRVDQFRSESIRWLKSSLTGPYLGRGAGCCGCTACATACPKEAIRMVPDIRGFLYPVVDRAKCIRCGKCEQTCLFSRARRASSGEREIAAYGARHRDSEEIAKSRSGAVFAALSDLVLSRGGVVYGAALKADFTVEHRRAETRQERDAFRGSKYVQSDLRGIFKQVRNDLESGRQVLFSGTPCQTAALVGILSDRHRENLLLVDVICHGVASPVDWRSRLLAEEMRREDSIVSVDFRNKGQFGWNAHRETCCFSADPRRPVELVPSFYRTASLRESCYACRYSTLDRPSDLTIGDFWGWQKVLPAMNSDDRGLNLVLVNSPKGREAFEAVSPLLDMRSVAVQDALQPNLMHPTSMPLKISLNEGACG